MVSSSEPCNNDARAATSKLAAYFGELSNASSGNASSSSCVMMCLSIAIATPCHLNASRATVAMIPFRKLPSVYRTITVRTLRTTISRSFITSLAHIVMRSCVGFRRCVSTSAYLTESFEVCHLVLSSQCLSCTFTSKRISHITLTLLAFPQSNFYVLR